MADNQKFELSARPPFPEDMLIELTNVCNHKCVFCSSKKMSRPKRRIDENLLYRLMGEAHRAGVTDIGLYSTGEPFLSRHLARYVARAKKIGFKYIYISTNGSLATPERVRPVIDAGLDSIKFSINAGTAGTYNAIHGRDHFDKVIENLIYISSYAKKRKQPLRIYVTYVVTPNNKEEKDTLKTLLARYVDDIMFFNVANQGGLMPEVGKFFGVSEASLIKQPPCRLLFNQLNITCEGYLSICCVDYQNYLVVADLNKTTLEEAWRSEAFVEMRQRHIDNDLKGSLCYNCLSNQNERVEPLMSEYATIYDPKSWERR